MNQLQALLTEIARDPAGLARIALVVAAVLILSRLLARVAWAAAKFAALVLVAALVLALVFGRPTRIGDLGALRQAALDAARDLLG